MVGAWISACRRASLACASRTGTGRGRPAVLARVDSSKFETARTVAGTARREGVVGIRGKSAAPDRSPAPGAASARQQAGASSLSPALAGSWTALDGRSTGAPAVVPGPRAGGSRGQADRAPGRWRAGRASVSIRTFVNGARRSRPSLLSWLGGRRGCCTRRPSTTLRRMLIRSPASSSRMAATGTAVPASARCTLASRPMSCARGSSGPSGGLRSTASPASLLRTNVRFDLPPETREASSRSQPGSPRARASAGPTRSSRVRFSYIAPFLQVPFRRP